MGINVAGNEQDVNAPAALTIPAYSENGSQMVNVTITNAPNGYGDLVISKDIVHNLESDPEAMAGKEFTFQVKLSGSKITAGMTFSTNENTTVTVDQNGNLTYENGKLIGFDVYVSPNVVTAEGRYKCLARTKRAVAFAEQLNEVEAYRPENRFADAVKGLHLYGAKIVYPKEILLLDLGVQFEII